MPIFVSAIITHFSRLIMTNILAMKNKVLAALMLICMAVMVTSCYSSRKSGCPSNPQANYKFRG